MYPLTDDWRRQIDARRKALQRRRNRRRGIADGGTTILGNGERLLNGISQTEEDFEEVTLMNESIQNHLNKFFDVPVA